MLEKHCEEQRSPSPQPLASWNEATQRNLQIIFFKKTLLFRHERVKIKKKIY